MSGCDALDLIHQIPFAHTHSFNSHSGHSDFLAQVPATRFFRWDDRRGLILAVLLKNQGMAAKADGTSCMVTAKTQHAGWSCDAATLPSASQGRFTYSMTTGHARHRCIPVVAHPDQTQSGGSPPVALYLPEGSFDFHAYWPNMNNPGALRT